MPDLPRPAVLAGFGACVVLIGLNFVAVRTSNLELAPTWGAALRFGVAAWLLLLLVLAARIPMPRGRALAGAALYGTLLFGVFFGLIYWGLVEVSAGVASIINATVPLLTFGMAWGVGIERFRWEALAGSLIVVLGIVVLVGSPGAAAPPARLAAVFLAAVAAALGGVVVKWFPRSHPLATNAVGMAVAFLILIVVSAVQEERWRLPEQAGTWGALAYLIASSLVLFPLFVWVIGEWTATATSYAVVLAPRVVIPVAAWLLSEPVGPRYGWAGVLVAAGVYVGALRGGGSDGGDQAHQLREVGHRVAIEHPDETDGPDDAVPERQEP